MLLSLLIASLLIMGSPGPSTISVTAVGAAFGLRRSVAYTSGLIAGTILVLLLVAMGVVAVLLAVPQLAPVLLGVSVGYVLYLAFRIATAPPLARSGRSGDTPTFAGGLLLALANPKAYVAIAAVFAGSALAPLLKVVVLAAMVVVIHIAWLVAGAGLARVLRDPLWSRRVNLSLAVALVAATVYSLT
jgi:threonine/homoserine/homoserine lactone efflux protein